MADRAKAVVADVQGAARGFGVAAEGFVGRCMRAAGFEYHDLARPSSLVEAGNPRTAMQDPSTRGAGPDAEVSDPAARANARYVAGLDDAQRLGYGRSLHGRDDGPMLQVRIDGRLLAEFPAEGCLAQARVQVGPRQDFTRLQELLWSAEELDSAIRGNAGFLGSSPAEVQARLEALESTWDLQRDHWAHMIDEALERARFTAE